MTDPASMGPCPICGRPGIERFKPFCSLRCADADLGRWFTGRYRVPGPPADDAEATGPQPLDPDQGVR